MPAVKRAYHEDLDMGIFINSVSDMQTIFVLARQKINRIQASRKSKSIRDTLLLIQTRCKLLKWKIFNYNLIFSRPKFVIRRRFSKKTDFSRNRRNFTLNDLLSKLPDLSSYRTRRQIWHNIYADDEADVLRPCKKLKLDDDNLTFEPFYADYEADLIMPCMELTLDDDRLTFGPLHDMRYASYSDNRIVAMDVD